MRTQIKNPNWTRDELILALNLYLTHRNSFPRKDHPDIILLSDQLNRLNKHITNKNDSFRNPNGVYMKLNNFKSIDPEYTESGKVGLWRISKTDAEIWNDYSSTPTELRQVANAILNNIRVDPETITSIGMAPLFAKEGKLLARIHITRERNQRLTRQKKEQALKQTGKLECEACNFVFEKKYGECGKGIIEGHHKHPLHALTPNTKTTLDDLALLCSNCHTLIHAQRPWISLDQLKKLIRN
jgi:5-methylcytosine-specific restriction protein A